MINKIIKSEVVYHKALKRALVIFDALPNTVEGDELELLLVLIKNYEETFIPLPKINTIDAIKYKMEELGIKPKDLAEIIGSKGHVSSILSGRKEITLKMAQRLIEFLRLPADVFLPVTT